MSMIHFCKSDINTCPSFGASSRSNFLNIIDMQTYRMSYPFSSCWANDAYFIYSYSWSSDESDSSCFFEYF